MNLTKKLLTTFAIGFSIILGVPRSSTVLAEALDQSEIRELAKNISVKIVESDSASNGSGVIFNRKKDVYSVLTNQHVAGYNGNYEIHTPDGLKHAISFKEEIPGLDLMVVQFESKNEYEIAPLGDSEGIAPLQLVYVAGFPAIQADLDIVDGKIRSIRQNVLKNPQENNGYALVYTNQTLPGSSGGAILDEKGNLIGINGEAERDLRSGRDISRGIPINLFISLSFNFLPEDQFELEEIPEDELEEQVEVEFPEDETETEDDDDDEDDETETEDDDDDEDDETETEDDDDDEDDETETEDDDDDEDDETETEDDDDDDDDDDEDEDDTIAYLPSVSSNNSSYSLAHNIAKEEGEINSVAITPNGQTIVTAGDDSQIGIWNGVSGKLEKSLSNHGDEVNKVLVSADGNTVISSNDNKINIWNRITGELERTLEGEEKVTGIALSQDSSTVVSADDDSKINVWNRTTGKLERTLDGHKEEIKSIAVSADGNTIVSGGQDRRIRVWNWRTWELKQTLKGHEEEIRAVAISSDGKTIASGSGDKTIKIWDLSGNLISTLEGHQGKVDSLVISDDGNTIVSGSRDRSIKIWNAQTATLEQDLTIENSDGIKSIAASSNEKVLVSSYEDNSFAIWHLKQ